MGVQQDCSEVLQFILDDLEARQLFQPILTCSEMRCLGPVCEKEVMMMKQHFTANYIGGQTMLANQSKTIIVEVEQH
jgi:hypothetical protein